MSITQRIVSFFRRNGSRRPRTRSTGGPGSARAVVIPREKHSISRSQISPNALKVLYRLQDAGYDAYLVGGCVRDLMLGREPKDFDVVTDARPEEIRKAFRNARLIGRRFRLAHIQFGREIIEVATFRATPGDDDERSETENGRLLRDNVFGNQEEDALRRDFTVNALYYNIRDFSVVDYVGGAQDLKKGVMRVIGDAATRYREDPVRMLRVIRFAAKLGFRIEERTAAPIREQARLLTEVSSARMFDEVLKLFHSGYAVETYELLRQYGLFRFLFPLTERSLAQEREGFPLTLLPLALASTDQRIAEDKPVNPAFLFAALLWEPVRLESERRMAAGQAPLEAQQAAAEEVLRQELKHVSIPKRYSFPMREIWTLQPRFERRAGKQVQRLVEHPRFRAAYDFLVLRAEAGEAPRELAQWWTRYQEVAGEEREAMMRNVAPSTGSVAGKRRRRGGRGRRPAQREPS